MKAIKGQHIASENSGANKTICMVVCHVEAKGFKYMFGDLNSIFCLQIQFFMLVYLKFSVYISLRYGDVSSRMFMIFCQVAQNCLVCMMKLQVVLGKPVSQVARRVSGHIRLPLLSPQELRSVEEENKDTKLFSVSVCRAGASLSHFSSPLDLYILIPNRDVLLVHISIHEIVPPPKKKQTKKTASFKILYACNKCHKCVQTTQNSTLK